MSHELLHRPKWRVIDQSHFGPLFDAKQSFAIDDALCTAVGAGQSDAVVRTWVHENTVVLGAADTKLPYIDEAISVFAPGRVSRRRPQFRRVGRCP